MWIIFCVTFSLVIETNWNRHTVNGSQFHQPAFKSGRTLSKLMVNLFLSLLSDFLPHSGLSSPSPALLDWSVQTEYLESSWMQFSFFIFQTFLALLIVAMWSTRNVKMVNLAPPLRLLGGLDRNQNYTCEKAVRLTALRNFHIYSLLFHSF